jgi:HEAT repeat protein
MRFIPSLLAVALTLAFLAPGQTQDAAADDDAKVLRDAGLSSDDAGLLAYFRDRTVTEERKAHLKKLVDRLGHRLYSVREKAVSELIKSGPLAVPLLKEALRNAELEVHLRAQQCLEKIEETPHSTLTTSAARLLAKRKPVGALETLLTYLPSSDWEATSDALMAAAADLGISDRPEPGVLAPALLKAAKDSDVRRRLTAAYALGRASPQYRETLYTLQKDGNAAVRLEAAVSLLRLRDRKAVDTLLALVGDGPLEVARQAEDMLFFLAGEGAPNNTNLDEKQAARRQARDTWEKWWDANQGKVDLAKIDLDNFSHGLIVTCEVDGLGDFPGRVCAFDRNGRKRWSVENLRSPADFELLRNGRILVAEHWAKRVTERDRQGNIKWEFKLNTHAVGCHRLRNGNTLIASQSEVVVVSPAGDRVFTHNYGGLHSAEVLPNGNFLLCDSAANIIELDKVGKQVMSFKPQKYSEGSGYWSGADYLGNGRYLVCMSGSSKVIETDAKGQVFKEFSVHHPCWATRARDGTTWATETDNRAIVQFNAQGKEIKRWKTQGRAFRVRIY